MSKIMDYELCSGDNLWRARNTEAKPAIFIDIDKHFALMKCLVYRRVSVFKNESDDKCCGYQCVDG